MKQLLWSPVELVPCLVEVKEETEDLRPHSTKCGLLVVELCKLVGEQNREKSQSTTINRYVLTGR